jgi:hypothetical protein
MTARRAERVLALAATALVAVAALVAASGSVRIGDGAAEWSRPCDARPARPDRERLARCAQVHGRVVWVRRQPGEVHLAVIARLHLFVVKLAPGAAAPAVGSSLTATGPLVRAHNGMREVQAFALSS